ncbi:MAG: class I SAM-dependent methyltransferase [Hyphomonadaceae bacterium]
MASIDTSPGGRKFGANAELYDFARPGYPPELYEWLQSECNLSPDTRCFEIGPGTGQATLPMLAMPVGSIVAIEPDAGLAAHLRAATRDPRLSISPLRFEAFDLGVQAFDFGFAAMSVHWLQRMKAYGRILTALRPGGHFAMWWNVFHDRAQPDAFDRAIAHLFDGLEQDPNATSKRPAFGLDVASRTGEMRSAGFADVRHRMFSQTISFSPERLSGLYATLSRVLMAPEATRTRLVQEVERIVREDFGGSVARKIVTSAYAARRSTSA